MFSLRPRFIRYFGLAPLLINRALPSWGTSELILTHVDESWEVMRVPAYGPLSARQAEAVCR